MQTKIAMRKLILSLSFTWMVIVFGVGFSALNAFASAPSITNGIFYLQSTQTTEGYWGDVTEVGYNTIVDTCFTADTLKYLGETGASYSLALQWINSSATTNNDYLGAKIITLAGAGWDIATLFNNLILTQNSDGAWGAEDDFESEIKRTASALLALQSANYPDQTIINNAISYLISNQNTDGGFGFYPSTCSGCNDADDSNIYMTALVSSTLQQFQQTTSIATAVNKATSYLVAHQNTDGGFGISPSTVYETALSVISLLQSGQGQALSLQNAINYLLTTQQIDGSWNQDPYSTASPKNT